MVKLGSPTGPYGSSLQAAVAGGHTEIVSILLEQGADLNAAEGRDGNSLQIAAAAGHPEIVGILLEKGANVNAAGAFYGSSLQVAAAGGHTEIVHILLEKGAGVNAAVGLYGSSLQIAVAAGHTKIVGILLEKGAYAAGGHTEILSAVRDVSQVSIKRCMVVSLIVNFFIGPSYTHPLSGVEYFLCNFRSTYVGSNPMTNMIL
jgi:ankyrin repeat protein